VRYRALQWNLLRFGRLVHQQRLLPGGAVVRLDLL
jgi:hypothetical protein